MASVPFIAKSNMTCRLKDQSQPTMQASIHRQSDRRLSLTPTTVRNSWFLLFAVAATHIAQVLSFRTFPPQIKQRWKEGDLELWRIFHV